MEAPLQPAQFPSEKKRHGCLTAWLILMMIMNPLVILLYLAGISTYSYLPGWYIPVMVVMAIINVIGAVLLFKWKKIGFWLFCATTVIGFFINMAAGLGFLPSLQGLIGLPILYGVLNIGGVNKGWPQLE